MTIRSRLDRVEHRVAAASGCPKGMDQATWRIINDAECIDISARMNLLEKNPPDGVDLAAYEAALRRRWGERRRGLDAGAPWDNDWALRQRRIIDRQLPPGMVLP